uniref:Transposable element Tc3 transposase n=1 Tax=Anoplophora glabripennis TaxID=217634 RepID=V5GT01_ANOGL
MRMWSSEKPDNFFVEGPLHAQKIGVWCALNRRRIYGPIFFNGTLTAQRYREEIIAPFVNQLEENEITNFYFQQDGARAHTAGETMNMLREVFQNRLISLNAEHEFPPRSCDITPCDFFLWPYLKNTIFELPIPDLNHLQARLIDKIREINNTPSILENVFNSLRNRCEKCLEQGGGHFQQLL